MSTTYGYYLIGVNYDTGMERGQYCPGATTCPRGTPDFRQSLPSADPFAESGFVQLKGSDRPEVFGNLKLSEAEITQDVVNGNWVAARNALAQKHPTFFEIFKIIYLVRVVE